VYIIFENPMGMNGEVTCGQTDGGEGNRCFWHLLVVNVPIYKGKEMALEQSKCCVNARYQLRVVGALLCRSY